MADLTADDLASNVPEASIDFCTLIFVLSAIDPSKMPQVHPHCNLVCEDARCVFERVVNRHHRYLASYLKQSLLDEVQVLGCRCFKTLVGRSRLAWGECWCVTMQRGTWHRLAWPNPQGSSSWVTISLSEAMALAPFTSLRCPPGLSLPQQKVSGMQ